MDSHLPSYNQHLSYSQAFAFYPHVGGELPASENLHKFNDFVALNRQNVGDNVGDVSVIDQLNDRINDQVKSLQLSENERKVFCFIKEFGQLNDQLTTTYIAKKLGLSYSTVQRTLRLLKQKNMVQRVGSKKTGSWQEKNHSVE